MPELDPAVVEGFRRILEAPQRDTEHCAPIHPSDLRGMRFRP